MPRTLWLSGLRHHLRHPWQLALSIVGIALGVAVVVAVDLANASARRAFDLSVESLAGRATHHVVGDPRGIDQMLYARLRRAGVEPAAPVVEGYLQVEGRTLTLLGLDPLEEAPFRELLADGGEPLDVNRLLTEPNSVLLAAATARELGLEVGGRFTASVAGNRYTLTLVGLLPGGAGPVQRQAQQSLAVADVSTAQELLGMLGRLSRIDLILPQGACERPSGAGPLCPDSETARRLLPADVQVVAGDSRSATMAQLTRAFSVNLTALSLLALLVGMFLVYNTMTFSVVQRRPLLGTLRALGANRKELFLLVGGEALAMGLVGTLLGAAVGIALGYGLVQLVLRTINDLYFTLNVGGLYLSPWSLAKGVLLGVGAATAAALFPAAEATRTTPALVLSRSQSEARGRRLVPRAALAGLALMAAGGLLLLWRGGGLAAGFVAIFALILGFALVVPLATLAGVRGTERIGGRLLAVPGRLALRGVTAALSRTAVAIAALAVAISVSVGMGVMVESFRTTVAHWLGYSLRADIYLSPPHAAVRGSSPPLAAGVLEQVQATPGVAALSTYRLVEVSSPQGPVRLEVLGLTAGSRAGYRFKEGNPAAAWDAFEQGAVLVSEPFAYHREVSVGDAITLVTDRGPRTFPVAGVFYDYESERGVVEIDRGVYRQLFDDPTVSGLGVYLEPWADAVEVADALRRRLAPLQSLRIRPTAELRAISLEVFDRTFAITEVLRLLALVVAFAGVLSALMALQLERAREFAILRATGMTPPELTRLVLTQTGVMGLAAGLLALPLGLLLAVVLIEVINRRAFGWSLWLQVPPEVLAQGVLLGVAAALLAGLYPARRMSRAPPAAALREE